MYKEIMSGGELVFNKGDKPNKKWAVEESSLPYSITK
jgi:putative alpha-1,2-mannosidase